MSTSIRKQLQRYSLGQTRIAAGEIYTSNQALPSEAHSTINLSGHKTLFISYRGKQLPVMDKIKMDKNASTRKTKTKDKT